MLETMFGTHRTSTITKAVMAVVRASQLLRLQPHAISTFERVLVSSSSAALAAA